MKLREIAERLSCRLQTVNDSDGEIEILRVAPIERAGPAELSFVANARYRTFLESTNAAALILTEDEEWNERPSLRGADPYLLLAQVIDLLYTEDKPTAGIHPSAVVADSANVDPSAAIGALCVIGADSEVGAGTILSAQVTVAKNVRIGGECRIHSGVRILDGTVIGDRVRLNAGTVIGSDGYGYASGAHGHKKILQVGNVVIEDDVEIGANCTVDRGALGSTKIGAGTKIDNLVQIAHNVQVGKHCLIVSQVGVSGSTEIGDWVTLAGQVGIVGHLKIGNQVIIAAQSGVTKDVPDKTVLFGSPAREMGKARRIEASLSRLPEIPKRIRDLEKELQALKDSLAD
jgi:UDP-3-O-[3-hydroxymyristoyl] glucosamine N-acyltransferase